MTLLLLLYPKKKKTNHRLFLVWPHQTDHQGGMLWKDVTWLWTLSILKTLQLGQWTPTFHCLERSSPQVYVCVKRHLFDRKFSIQLVFQRHNCGTTWLQSYFQDMWGYVRDVFCHPFKSNFTLRYCLWTLVDLQSTTAKKKHMPRFICIKIYIYIYIHSKKKHNVFYVFFICPSTMYICISKHHIFNRSNCHVQIHRIQWLCRIPRNRSYLHAAQLWGLNSYHETTKGDLSIQLST